MAIQNFYTGLEDVNLAKDAIFDQAKLYIQRYVYVGSGVLDKDTPAAATLTPAVSPAWTIDELISTVAKNLLIVDDNGKVCAAKVADNTATEITFDSTACLKEEDETTAGSFTDSSTYNFYVLTPSSTTGNTYGPFWGYSEGIALNYSQTYSDFKYGKPRKLVFRDLEEVVASVTGGHVNWSDPDTLQAIFSASTYGKQTTQTAFAMGSANTCGSSAPYYRLSFKVKDRNCRDIWIIVRKVQFNAEGNIFGESESGLSMINFNAMVLADGFYPETSDLVQVIRAN